MYSKRVSKNGHGHVIAARDVHNETSSEEEKEEVEEQGREEEREKENVVVKQAVRGRAALLNLDSSTDDEEEEDHVGLFGASKTTKGPLGKKQESTTSEPSFGIYGHKLNQTKREVKAVQHEFHEAESKRCWTASISISM